MNTVNTIDPFSDVPAWMIPGEDGSVRGVSGRYGGTGSVFSGLGEYTRTGGPVDVPNAGIGVNRPRHAPVVCIVFRCIQMPNAYKSGLKALLP